MKSKRQVQKSIALHFLPSSLRSRILKNHRIIERVLYKKVPIYSFEMNRYLKMLDKLGVSQYYIDEAKTILLEAIPYRNDSIRKVCKNAVFPVIEGISPCGLITNLKFPCYVCKMDFNRFGSRLQRLNKTERLALIEKLVGWNKAIKV